MALAIAAGAATTVAALTAVAPAAHAATRTTAKTVAADNCWSASGHWWCHNRAGAPVWSRGDNPVVVGYMNTTTSWFNCRKEGAKNNNGPHPNRWEWTEADNGAWGWMKDSDIISETNPLPGLPCP
ncbi:hypothetical protein [Actinomadura sp. DC4]|uniref:hypothetical protein n=1 Tax=Actinomadura sp. DC4 TaxID=3055069 RepID=UPI0025AFB59F|nr:hypothetical protein [Actinomadura sp. DC4]MDN3357772.1 hypothetical protein [Actinomadura sp. DC4]